MIGALVPALLLLGPTRAPAAEAGGLPFEGEAGEAFLREAAVVKNEALPYGVTRSRKLTLSEGTRTACAASKTIEGRAGSNWPAPR